MQVEVGENENFIAKLIDTGSGDEEGLGRLTDVIQIRADDADMARRYREGRRSWLPAIRDCILDVNVDEKRMTVHVMEGLLD